MSIGVVDDGKAASRSFCRRFGARLELRLEVSDAYRGFALVSLSAMKRGFDADSIAPGSNDRTIASRVESFVGE